MITEKQEAITALLELPDPPEMPERTYRQTVAGKPLRFRMLPRLLLTSAVYAYAENRGEL